MGSIYRRKYLDRHGVKRIASIWWLKYYVNGRPICESSETNDYEEAKIILKQREGEAAKGKPVVGGERKVTFADLAKLEINDYKTNNYSTLDDLEIRLNKHVLPFFGHLKATKIGPADIKQFIVRRQEEGAANGTINRELTAVIRAFSLGVECRLISYAPKVDTLREDNVRKGFFEREQLNGVLKRMRAHNQNPARFAFITGWRKQEILGLRWPQIDFQAGVVRLEPGTTKNREARQFPFTSELREILEAQKAKAGELKKQHGVISPWVFFIEEKGPRKGRKIGDFKRNWNTACRAAGVPGRIFHDLRRTSVRNLVRAGIPERVAMAMTGHRTRDIFERYNIVDEGDFAEAALKLEAFSSRTGTDTGTVKKIRKGKKAVSV